MDPVNNNYSVDRTVQLIMQEGDQIAETATQTAYREEVAIILPHLGTNINLTG